MRDSSAVYESTVVVINDGRRPSIKSNCAKYGAPALAAAGILIGVVALTLVAVGATRGGGSSIAPLRQGPMRSNFNTSQETDGVQEARMAGPAARSEDDEKWLGPPDPSDEPDQEKAAQVSNEPDNPGNSSAFIGMGAALLVAAVCVVLFAFHSKGHNVMGVFKRDTHSSTVSTPKPLGPRGSKTSAGPSSLVKKLSTISGRGGAPGVRTSGQSLTTTGPNATEGTRDARNVEETKRLVEGAGNDVEAGKPEPLVTMIA